MHTIDGNMALLRPLLSLALTLSLALPAEALVKSVPVLKSGVGTQTGAAGVTLNSPAAGMTTLGSGPLISLESSALPGTKTISPVNGRSAAPVAAASVDAAPAAVSAAPTTAPTAAAQTSLRSVQAGIVVRKMPINTAAGAAEKGKMPARDTPLRDANPAAGTTTSAAASVKTFSRNTSNGRKFAARTSSQMFDGTVSRPGLEAPAVAASMADQFRPRRSWLRTFVGRGERTQGRAGVDRDPTKNDPINTPLPWSRLKRYIALAGILSALAFVPSLLNATPISSMYAVLGPALQEGAIWQLVMPSLGVFANWPLLVAAAAVIAVAGIPLRVFTHKLSPWIMRRVPDEGEKLMRTPLPKVLPQLAVMAALEELGFRGAALPIAAVFLMPFMPQVPAFALASFLSSFVFAIMHGYGPVWTRVVGGMLYAAGFAVTGTLFFPILTHFFFNLSLYIYNRLQARSESGPAAA